MGTVSPYTDKTECYTLCALKVVSSFAWGFIIRLLKDKDFFLHQLSISKGTIDRATYILLNFR